MPADIIQNCSDQSPLEYAISSGLFPAIGIFEGDLVWDTNAEGPEGIGVGLLASPRQMASLGMLFLQNGRSGSTQVVNAEKPKNAEHEKKLRQRKKEAS
jgi:hypothetical protein